MAIAALRQPISAPWGARSPLNIPQQLVNGLVLGSGYACVALGWTVLLGAAKLIELRTRPRCTCWAPSSCWFVMTRLGFLSYPVGILASLLALGVLGVLMPMGHATPRDGAEVDQHDDRDVGHRLRRRAAVAWHSVAHRRISPAGSIAWKSRFGDIWFHLAGRADPLRHALVLYGLVWSILRSAPARSPSSGRWLRIRKARSTLRHQPGGGLHRHLCLRGSVMVAPGGRPGDARTARS